MTPPHSGGSTTLSDFGTDLSQTRKKCTGCKKLFPACQLKCYDLVDHRTKGLLLAKASAHGDKVYFCADCHDDLWTYQPELFVDGKIVLDDL